ncbi:uncharacterized protein LOC119005429 isoform X2 [Acanthopagrus latus]|uniref:uncharacterized protein LOC119005429 isoform X2 n=1 Tax=Acanthopagrus latus TaxID=8177 RepID=UPI00187C9C82|nr:uncharacterized protein LOC119005429 isoform X2 [Acanthopagrus latus]
MFRSVPYFLYFSRNASALRMMQRGFIFLLIIWNIPVFAAGHTTNHLQVMLGCRAVIPCQWNRSDSTSLKWLYKKDEYSKKIDLFVKGKKGVPRYHELFRTRMTVLSNGSLHIHHLTDEDQGIYWCEICFQDDCSDKQIKTILSKAILKETYTTIDVAAGSNFTHPSCQGQLTELKWTFEARNTNSIQRLESDIVTSNKSIHIVNVERADAGKYTCWSSRCDGHWQKLLTINLCVFTVHSEESPVSCDMLCDMDFSDIKPNDASNVKTETRTVTVDQYGSLNCSTKQVFDRSHSVHSTQRPLKALNTTTDTPTEPGNQILIYGTTAAALMCLILMVLLICFLRPRLRAAFPIHPCCCGFKGTAEEETSVIYSSIVIRRPAEKTDVHMTYTECLYSDLKFEKKGS